MATEKIKIVKIGRKTQPSKYKPGETFNITTILDEKNRKMTAMGKWSDGWKLGDIVEAEIENKKYTDKDGFEQMSLSMKNPNATAFTGKGGFSAPAKSVWAEAYTIAATLAPLLYAGNKKKVVMADIDGLAGYIKAKIDVVAPNTAQPKAEDVPTVKVDEAVKPITSVSEEEPAPVITTESEEDRPF